MKWHEWWGAARAVPFPFTLAAVGLARWSVRTHRAPPFGCGASAALPTSWRQRVDRKTLLCNLALEFDTVGSIGLPMASILESPVPMVNS